MTTLEIASLGLLLAGSTLCLSVLPWFRDRSLIERLRPYSASARAHTSAPGSVLGIGQVLGPIARDAGARINRLLGISTDVRTRLHRAGREPDDEGFRLRQLSYGVLALIGTAATALLVRPQPAMSAALVVAGPTLTVLLLEQELSRAGEERTRRLGAELPVLVEQLGLLVSAGYSVTGALTRLAGRSGGVAAADLRRVLMRIRHGVPEQAALGEWAQVSDLDAIGRLTSILALHGETADLGVLISEEARSIRGEAHREMLETIERKAQLVWIPVTVATLVPGLIFLAVPFTSAMSQVTGGS